MSDGLTHLTIGALVTASILAAPVVGLSEGAPPSPAQTLQLLGCGEMNDGTPRKDYRQRNVNAVMRGQLMDSWKNHYEPAMETMRQGRYTRGVLADLHFVLRGWPNHHAALQAMVQYDLAGGRRYEFKPTACYLARAEEFAPTDVEVLLITAYYQRKKGETTAARQTYDSAIALEPGHAEAHYHLGLLLLDLGDYAGARENAWAAYAAGYPLPGLRDRLVKAGQWRDPPKPDPAGQPDRD